MKTLLSMTLMLVLVVKSIAAETNLPPEAVVKALVVTPAQVHLTNKYAYSQIIVTAFLADGSGVDVTREVVPAKTSTTVSISKTGMVTPLTDGTETVDFVLAGAKVSLPVHVSQIGKVPNISFVQDVQPLLSKLGCNQGTCHGAAAGKSGFKLSLRGYDPLFDHRALTDDLEGRRFNRAAPDRSLMIMKPAGVVPHAGGVLFSPGDRAYGTVKDWIAAGVNADLKAPKVAKIEVFPKNPTIGRVGQTQQFAVIATYTDGRTRDVSADSFVDSSNTEIATVDKAGLVTTVRRGEATMLVRYEGAYTASTVIVTGDRTGFVWQDRPKLNHIDELVDKKLKAVKIQPSDLCDDSEFVRRVYIDLIGLPPTSDQVRAFLLDKTPSQVKRETLIDKLVGSPDYIDHWTIKWADMLQVNRKFLGDQGAKVLQAWIKDAVANNMPYDKFAYAILTGSGSNVENPPAAYFKVLRTPDAVMENTTQLFMAIRFNCNKCHDHPFEKWTQDQYYELSAFFARIDRKEDPKYKGQKLGGTAVEKPLPLVEVIADMEKGDFTHERTSAIAVPTFPFSHEDLPKDTLPRRERVAKWITSTKNPYFAKSYVNRVWSYLTGVGIIEPVDDIRAGNPPTNPELLDRLTADFIASGFDTRKLIQTICKSRTYQLSVAVNKWNKDDEMNYSHAIARRLPAEVLYDAVHRVTGSIAKLPGLPAGARAAQLVDSNVQLPGGFLDLLGKPVRESACECERSSGMMLGPVLAMVSGPVIGDAIQDPKNHIATMTAREKDDSKVVEEIYLSVLCRFPTATEREAAIKALRAAGPDHEALLKEYAGKKKVFDDYAKTLDTKQAAWETGLRNQKPTEWIVLEPKTVKSQLGQNPGASKESSTLTVQKDFSILVSGKNDVADLYTVTANVKHDKPLTGMRLEALTDASLPSKGPGRAVGGNFVLSELKVSIKPEGAKGNEAKPKAIKLQKPQATFQQDGFPIANAIDNNNATGWAVAPQQGRDHAAMFDFTAPVNAKAASQLTFVFEQRYGQNHTLGKFRLSVTVDKPIRLTSPVTPEMVKLLDTNPEERTKEQKAELRRRYLAQDTEYQNLNANIAVAPPADARVLGAQDLAWALINSPSFIFNR